MTLSPSDILLLICLGVIVLWTIRLARARGLNPWPWVVGVVLLIAIAWNYFSRPFIGPVAMAPLVFLLLFRSPLFRRNQAPASVPCPRCAAPDTGGLNFCVQCGWDLSKSYPNIGADASGVEEPASAAPEPPREPEPVSPAFDTTYETPPEPVAEPVSEYVTPAPPEPATGPAADSATERETETAATEPVLAQEVAPPPPEAEPPRPAPRRIPTAASMTERGIALFSQGRFQEAVDQFTKAIALDPKYRLAWERRAEAYGRLGRAEQEAADKRQLEAI